MPVENIEQVIVGLPDNVEFTIPHLARLLGVRDGYIRQEITLNRLPRRKKEGGRDLYLFGSDVKEWWKNRPGLGGRWPEGKRARRRPGEGAGKHRRKAIGEINGEK